MRLGFKNKFHVCPICEIDHVNCRKIWKIWTNVERNPQKVTSLHPLGVSLLSSPTFLLCIFAGPNLRLFNIRKYNLFMYSWAISWPGLVGCCFQKTPIWYPENEWWRLFHARPVCACKVTIPCPTPGLCCPSSPALPSPSNLPRPAWSFGFFSSPFPHMPFFLAAPTPTSFKQLPSVRITHKT